MKLLTISALRPSGVMNFGFRIIKFQQIGHVFVAMEEIGRLFFFFDKDVRIRGKDGCRQRPGSRSNRILRGRNTSLYRTEIDIISFA
jgi:hypothetical protein